MLAATITRVKADCKQETNLNITAVMKRPEQFPKKTSKTKSDVPNFVRLLTNTVANPSDIHLYMDQEFSSKKIREYLEEKGKYYP